MLTFIPTPIGNPQDITIRAMKLFESFGLHPIAAPADFHMDAANNYLSYPGLGALNNSAISLHEYLGILWGKVKKLLQ